LTETTIPPCTAGRPKTLGEKQRLASTLNKIGERERALAKRAQSYKRVECRVSPDDYDRILSFCERHDEEIASAVRLCLKYGLDHYEQFATARDFRSVDIDRSIPFQRGRREFDPGMAPSAERQFQGADAIPRGAFVEGQVDSGVRRPLVYADRQPADREQFIDEVEQVFSQNGKKVDPRAILPSGATLEERQTPVEEPTLPEPVLRQRERMAREERQRQEEAVPNISDESDESDALLSEIESAMGLRDHVTVQLEAMIQENIPDETFVEVEPPEDVPPEPVKRKRGRPRKNPVPE
jgi:hypothetical protein